MPLGRFIKIFGLKLGFRTRVFFNIQTWERTDHLTPLCVMFTCVFVTSPYDVSSQVWYLIVSILAICLLLDYSYILINKHHFCQPGYSNHQDWLQSLSQYKQVYNSGYEFDYVGAQLLSGRMLDLRLMGCWFEPHQLHCIVSLSKTH